MKKVYWLFVAPLSIFVGLYFLLKFLFFPLVNEFAKEELNRISKSNNVFEIKFEKLDFHILDPNIEVLNISIISKKEFEKVIQVAKVERLNFQIDLFQLILGKLSFNLLTLKNINLELNIDSLLQESSATIELPMNEFYNLMSKVPIERFKFDNISLEIKFDKQNKSIKILDGLIRTSYINQKFILRALLLRNEIKDYKSNTNVPFKLDLNLLLTKNNLVIRQFNLESDIVDASIEGQFKNIQRLLISPEGSISFKNKTQLHKGKEFLTQFNFFEFKKELSGDLKVDGEFDFSGSKNINGKLAIQTNELKYDEFDFGSASIKGDIKNNIVKLSNIELVHPSGKLTLQKSQFNIESPHEFKGEISAQHIDLQNLFLSLKLKNIPVWLNFSPNLSCEGNIKNFNLFCKGTVTGNHLVVSSSYLNKTPKIVEIEDFSANGDFNLNTQKIIFKSDIVLFDSQGESSGEVDFDKGFDIKYSTKNVDFKNIKNLADLEFKGQVALQGQTKGDSHSAVFDMNVQSKNFELEKYRFGNLNTLLNYDKGTLFFRQVSGGIHDSIFKGDLDLDLLNSRISGFVDFSKSRISDLTQIFDQVIPIPFYLEGSGSGRVEFNGPLNFWKLNYSLMADFSEVVIFKDLFKNLKINIHAKEGTADFDGTSLSKNKSNLKIFGSINSNKTFDLKGESNVFKLEESQFIKNISNQFSGSFKFSMGVKGEVTSPNMDFKISIFDSLIGDKVVDSSQLSILLNKNYIDFNNNFFAGKLLMKARFPIKEDKASFIFDSEFSNFDVTDLFPLIGATSIQNDYFSSLTGNTKLSASNAKLNDLNGDIYFEKFYLKRGDLQLSLEEPTQLIAQNGTLNLKNLVLQGQDNLIQITGEKFTLDKLNIQVNSKSDLRLFHFLFPFLEELSGKFELGATLTGSIEKIKVLGQAQVNEAFLKFKNFIHSFDRIKTNLVFSQSKVFFQNISTQFAGGQVKGDGQLEYMDSNRIPVFLKLKGDNLALNIPEKVKSSGNAELVFSGQNLPYLLSGTYNISGGVFEKEFEEGSGGMQTHESKYLPQILKETKANVFNIDILLNLDNKYLVKNSQIEGYVTGSLQLKGAPTSALLIGKLQMEKGTKLFFKDKIFDLQTGLINFVNPNEINPDLYISATSRVNEYDINLILQGPAKTSVIKMTSIPPLAETEIISLLALGVTSTKLDQNVQSKDQAAQTGYEIGAAVLSQSSITKNLRNRLGLDIQFVNQFDSTKNISVLKATVSKKVTNKIQATASRSLGNEANSEVKIQYLFNQNISAVGNWEGKEAENIKSNEKESQSVFGLDLEFKKEFR